MAAILRMVRMSSDTACTSLPLIGGGIMHLTVATTMASATAASASSMNSASASHWYGWTAAARWHGHSRAGDGVQRRHILGRQADGDPVVGAIEPQALGPVDDAGRKQLAGLITYQTALCTLMAVPSLSALRMTA